MTSGCVRRVFWRSWSGGVVDDHRADPYAVAFCIQGQISYRRMPKRKEPPLPPQEQFKRFIEAAQEHGADERDLEIKRAFKKIAQRLGKSSKP